mmetsp:Transcript_2278/g.3284  ORF Transcript_2278/g.3284 Transcript_2278/m.3284 type:complete len:152 (+) Transcript_2278:90-545(+)
MAYAQQRTTLLTREDIRCPRLVFVEDICNEISNWQEEGDSIVLAFDVNEPIVDSSISEALEHIRLKEAIINKYKGTPPATHNRGSHTIDGIFVSCGLEIESGGYLGFGEGIPSDHCAAWVDIAYSNGLGHPLPPISRPKACRLQCNDPRTI